MQWERGRRKDCWAVFVFSCSIVWKQWASGFWLCACTNENLPQLWLPLSTALSVWLISRLHKHYVVGLTAFEVFERILILSFFAFLESRLFDSAGQRELSIKLMNLYRTGPLKAAGSTESGSLCECRPTFPAQTSEFLFFQRWLEGSSCLQACQSSLPAEME